MKKTKVAAKRPRGRPRTGRHIIPVSLQTEELQRLDSLARIHDMNRPQALRLALATVTGGERDLRPARWNRRD